LFSTFKENTTGDFIVNQCHPITASLSTDRNNDFSSDSGKPAGYLASDMQQEGLAISFNINGYPFHLNSIGKHNMENAVAAVAVANRLGVDMETCSMALSKYEGIYRRHQLLGIKNGVYVIDDYAHNPVKCAASVEACQPIASKVIAWFQPHGYGPTRFLKNDFISEFVKVLRPQDEIWMSEIFYAGGTAVKDISSNDLIKEIAAQGKNAFFVENRDELLESIRPHLTNDCVLLLMGARDPGLESFCQKFYDNL
jgi:UDP-N-acetylmuramate--alanine ligase